MADVPWQRLGSSKLHKRHVGLETMRECPFNENDAPPDARQRSLTLREHQVKLIAYQRQATIKKAYRPSMPTHKALNGHSQISHDTLCAALPIHPPRRMQPADRD